MTATTETTETIETTSTTFSYKQLQRRYEDLTASVEASCVIATPLVGGITADESGIRNFVAHQLKLKDQDAEDAVRRIMREEVGERDITPEAGEIKEKQSYGINVVRRDHGGPFLGDWMLKACLKSAASRIGLFVEKRGAKGDIAEMGLARASGVSLLFPDQRQQIYLRDPTGNAPAATHFEQFKGRVQSPQGAKSIVNDAECVAVGSRFEFTFRFYDKRLKSGDIADIFACAMTVGLGSCKSFERGKFRIEKLTFTESKPKK